MPDFLAPAPAELLAEDAKLVTLARAARARVGAVEGAAVRDGDGRTYTGVTVSQPSFALGALQLAVASAVAAGANVLEAAAVVTEASTVDDSAAAAVRDIAGKAPIFLANPAGHVLGVA
jgi:cytidine deaminase